MNETTIPQNASINVQQASASPILAKPNTVAAVAERNTTILYETTSLFPFDFFPATITIDLQKISIVDKLFFFSKQIMSIPIGEILVVECDVSLFFATLRIRDKRFELEPIVVNFLPKENAQKARRIIQGLITMKDQQLDASGMSIEELRINVEKIGRTYAGTL